jgi:Ca-activated chloride channel family protein
MNNDQHDDLQDRLMDIALRRKFGTEKACDIAEKVGDVTALRATPLISRTWFRLVIAASVMAVIGWKALELTIVTELTASYDKPSIAFSDSANAHIPSERRYVIERNAELAELAKQSIQLRSTIKEERVKQILDAPILNAYGGPPNRHQVWTPELRIQDATPLGEGIVVYNLPSTGERYDRTPVLPPVPEIAMDFGNEATLHVWIDIDEKGRHIERRLVDRDGDGRADETRDFAIEMEAQGRDRFARLNDNRFLGANDNPLSTFSIDVDTASYSVIRSRIERGEAPPPASVRVEELINYFSYNYPQPTDGAPFAVHVDVAACPWKTSHRLVRIGLKGKEIAKADRPASNLVFLVDVSGSMQPQNKLPLVRQGLLRLVSELDERDRVAIVVYAGNSGCVLASTPCTQSNKERIRSAIAALESGGSTNGEAGIQLAYQIAQDHFVKGGANRVILCTDGDFNVGTTDDESLKKLVADRAKSGVFLTALGFGMGNHNDQMLEAIADNGNGTYGYIDDEREVEKLFVRQLSGTLITIAKDVKIQVEFNPAQVGAYRLIGYENRILAHEDFNNDKKDAGDIGAGHTVTALYEIVPPSALAEANKLNAAASEGTSNTPGAAPGNVDALEFQRPKQELELTDAAKNGGDMLLVKLRYKAPDGDTSTLIRTPTKDAGTTFAAANSDFKFAASVAGFGMYLRQSPFRGDITLAAVEEIANANIGEDSDGQRKAFVDLVRQVRGMTGEGRGARD